MMKKGLILLTTLFLINNMSCSSAISKKINSDECKEYYLYILSHWRTFSSESYNLRTPGASDWIQEHLKKDCLIGLQPQNIFRIFGKPTEEMVTNFPHIRYLEYCFAEDGCIRSSGLTPNSLIFEFDESDKVVDVYITPPRKNN